jgi:hypothetical protein
MKKIEFIGLCSMDSQGGYSLTVKIALFKLEKRINEGGE